MQDIKFQATFARLVQRFFQEFAAISVTEHCDFSVYTREFYWLVVLVMVLGEEALEDTDSMQEMKKM